MSPFCCSFSKTLSFFPNKSCRKGNERRSNSEELRSSEYRWPIDAALRSPQPRTAGLLAVDSAFGRFDRRCHGGDLRSDLGKAGATSPRGRVPPLGKTIVRNISFCYRRKAARDRHVFEDDLVRRLLTEDDLEQAGANQSERECSALILFVSPSFRMSANS